MTHCRDVRGDGGGEARDVRRCRAAAPADEVQPELVGELGYVADELVGPHRVHRAVRAEFRQAGVGHADQLHAGIAGEVSQVLAHLRRPGAAVQPDRVDVEGAAPGDNFLLGLAPDPNVSMADTIRFRGEVMKYQRMYCQVAQGEQGRTVR